MTIGEVLNRFDRSRAGQHDRETKIEWLSNFEMQVWRDLVLTHEHDEKMDTFGGYADEVPMDTLLILPMPHDQCYVQWLKCMSDLENNETARYQNDMQLFNALYADACRWWGKTHRDIVPKKNYFKF